MTFRLATKPWLAAAGIPLLVAVNYLWFRQLGSNYLTWYLNSGALIGVVTAVFATAWGDMDKNVLLISPRPSRYVSGCLLVVSLPFISIGAQIESLGKRISGNGGQPKTMGMIFDALIMLPFLLALIFLIVFWFIVIAPLQYFTFLICGSLPRSLLRSQFRVIAHLNGVDYETRLISEDAPIPEDWWNASLSRKPITLTAALSGLLTLGLRTLLES